MRTLLYLIVLFLVSGMSLNAQVGVSSDNSSPDPSAMLDVKSTTKGVLLPRLSSTQMNAIPSPATGLIVYNTTLGTICWYNDSIWTNDHEGSPCGTVSYSGKTYNGITIGTQCWMTQNLNIGTRINSTTDQTNNGIIEKFCFGNLESNCDVYGGLYQWNEMMGYATASAANPSGRQGICPAGWHIPSDAEWCQLETHLDVTIDCSLTGPRGIDAGSKMKETGNTHWNDPNTDATNSSGFTALPGGFSSAAGVFYSIRHLNEIWSTTQHTSGSFARIRFLNYIDGMVNREIENKESGLSVRCLKD